MPRFQLVDDDSDSDSERDYGDPQQSSSATPGSSNEEAENEPPHPLGFPTPKRIGKGQSRYRLDWSDDEDDWLERKVSQPTRKQPPISSYLRTGDNSTPMKTLVKDAFLDAAKKNFADQEKDYDDTDGDDDLTLAMQVISLSKPTSTALVPRNTLPPPNLSYYSSLRQKEQDCRDFSQKFEDKTDRQTQVFRENLQSYIDHQRKEAERITREREKKQREDEERAAEEARQKESDRIRQEEADKAKKIEDEKNANIKAEEDAKLQATKDAETQRLAEAEKKRKEESQFIQRAQKYVGLLEKVRQSIEPFDKSKPMAKRRLAMKKIVNGRVNTLSEDVAKIQAVAADVNAAIATARHDDADIKSKVESGDSNYTIDMTCGKRYFLDLLSSKVVVRVQAEGFNGQRGDGFPLAHMLAIVGKANPDFKYAIEPHIYKVCPTAIPHLPTPSETASEDELMESLGMQKAKDGNFESFERFLNRTEGIISIVADIVASAPPDHGLFGGPEGGVKWLQRFLKQLPNPPHSPLPLLTAPVLDAFLTGAGHMLANCYQDEFKEILAQIDKDIMSRLDEGSIGMPSAIRLRKTLQGGFDGFRDNLPSRALETLYHGAGGQGAAQVASASTPFNAGASTAASTSNAPNPFNVGGSAANAQASPFVSAANTDQRTTQSTPQSGAANPFGMGPSTMTSTPFGNTPAPATQHSSPFENATNTAGNQARPNPNSAFNQAPNAAPAASPFGTTAPLNSAFSSMQTPAPSPFTSTDINGMNTGSASGPSPFAAPSPSPFGSSAPAPTPFGGASAAPSPFGGQSSAPGPSPFGGAAPGPSPFGSGPAPAPTPFGGGAPAPTPFASNAPAPSPFGNPGFGAAAPGPSPFGSTAPTPFGAGTNTPGSSNTPFGSGPSPFGSSTPASGAAFGGMAPGPSPFGAPAPAPTPFGSAAPAPTPFGGGGAFGAPASSPSPFGNFSTAPAPTPFGGNTNQPGGGFGGTGKQPCRFFAKGQCKYGTNCKFSHDIQPSSNTFSSPFGGPRR